MVGPSILIQLQRATGLLAADMETLQIPSRKNIAMIFLMQFMTSFCVFIYVQMSDKLYIDKCPNEQYAAKEEDKLFILVWTWPIGETFTLANCEKTHGVSGCHLTTDRRMYDQAGAVVLHHQDVCSSSKQLPQSARPPNQYWLWFNMESPSHSPNLKLMDNLINLTMSYREDSDIFNPFGWLETLQDPQNFTMPTKSKLVSWVVSNWKPWSKQVQYYDELTKYIQIDVFGHEHLPLDKYDTISTISQYKFYLAFEKSQHQDYITEQLWYNALLSGTVPIVLGPTRENYERFLPAEAFIHVDDFPSAKEMAAYLKSLDTDHEKYKGYFDWRRQLQVVGQTHWTFPFCKACQHLKQNITYRTVPSVAKWFN